MTLYRIDLETEKPGVGRYLANDRELFHYLKNREVLVPVEPDRAKLFEAFDQCEEMETEAEVVDHLLAAILGAGKETP